VKEDEDEARWPSEGDRLFVEAHRGYAAQVVAHPGERFYRLPKGYKRAGDILTEQALDDPVDRRNIVYAALFCYRQSIELFLKSLIHEFGQDGVKYDHRLNDLWKGFTKLSANRGCRDVLGMKAAESLVLEMHEADARSDGFRFATDTKGAPFGFGDRFIDLENLRSAMEALSNFFECAALEFYRHDSME